MNKIKIIFYTGTGGSKIIAELIKNKLIDMNYDVFLEKISKNNLVSQKSCDLIILIFPLHGANAPEIVYKWIKNLPKGNKTKVAIISISAGGEVIFNRAGRLSSIKLFERQDYKVFYENSLIMPSNFLIPTPDYLSRALLNILPEKIDLIIDDLVNEKIRKINPPIIDKCISKVFEIEKIGVKILGKTIKANENCNGCGLCEKICSCGNISMNNKKPKFKFMCNFCTACLYYCPNKALQPSIFKMTILKNGYNINSFIKNNMKDENFSDEDIMELTESIYWSGLRDYLLYSNKKV